jgi:hypothetical protein
MNMASNTGWESTFAVVVSLLSSPRNMSSAYWGLGLPLVLPESSGIQELVFMPLSDSWHECVGMPAIKKAVYNALQFLEWVQSWGQRSGLLFLYQTQRIQRKGVKEQGKGVFLR